MHWSEESVETYADCMGGDFLSEIEAFMIEKMISGGQLASMLEITEEELTQIFEKPAELSLKTISEITMKLGLRPSIVCVEKDPERKHGPVHPCIFAKCWEKQGKPEDGWGLFHVEEEE